MNKSFLQRLQRVKPKDLLHIFLFIIAIIPSMIYKYTHPSFWMISECKDEARDNAYWLYRYIVKNTKQNVIYVIDKKSSDYNKIKTYGKIIQYGGLMHWIIYLACDIRISTQKTSAPNDAVGYILEVFNIIKKKSVFLQHGIIKDDLPYVHANQAKFSLFTTSTTREYQYVKDNFGFEDGIVQQLGLCRFDDLNDESKHNVVLIMPTWRQWIANPDSKTKDVEQFNTFAETEYFNKWQSLISSETFNNTLKKHNKTALFYVHRKMQNYNNEFKGTENVKIAKFPQADVHNLLKFSSLLITDYSSVAMDFAYMYKPVLYYQFDYDKFRKNHLSEGYYSYEMDGFGEIKEKEEDVTKVVEEYILNDFQMKEIYKNRAETFFDLRDTNNCKRTYDAITLLTK